MNKKISIISPYGSQLYFAEETIPYGGAEVRAREIIKSLSKSESVSELKLFVHGQKKIKYNQTFQNDKLKVYKINFLTYFELQKKLNRASEYLDFIIFSLHRIFGKLRFLKSKSFIKIRKIIIDKLYQILSLLFGLIASAMLCFNLIRLGLNISKSDEIIIFGVHSFNLFVFRCLSFLSRKKFVLFLTSDDNVSDATFNDKLNIKFDNYKSYIKHHFILLNKIKRIVCQNNYQMNQLQKHFNKKLINLKSPTEIFDTPEINLNKKKFDFIWIGKIDFVKDFIYLIELVKKFSDFNFVIFISAINMSKKKIPYDFINLENIKFFKYANNEFVYEYIKKSRYLINTSKFEGFPNTFLEAMKYRVPLISLNVNPNNIFEKYNVGFFANSDKKIFEDKILSTKNMNENEYKDISNGCYNYILENHDQSVFNKRFLNFLEN